MRQLHYDPQPMHRLVVPAVIAAVLTSGCQANDPVAAPMVTPTLTLSRTRLPLGTPVEMTYKFAVAKDAKFTQDYHVMVHFADQDEQLMYTDDHDPPTPTSRWKAGETIEYTRTFFTPAYPYVGDASVEIGLYASGEKLRVPMEGTDTGHRSYRIAKFQILAQTEGVPAIYLDGWHQVEGATANGVGWHWTKREGTLAVKNPKKDSVFYLEVDNPSALFTEAQQITVSTGAGVMLDRFAVTSKQPVLRKVAVSSSAWGGGDNAELKIAVDKTFVPSALSPAAHDTRELGIRVMHAAIVTAQ